VLRVNWSMGAKLYIGAAPESAASQEPDMESELGRCVTLIRRWPPDVVFSLHTQSPVTGKLVLGRDDVALLPEPE
jgi:hypothetical protein